MLQLRRRRLDWAEVRLLPAWPLLRRLQGNRALPVRGLPRPVNELHNQSRAHTRVLAESDKAHGDSIAKHGHSQSDCRGYLQQRLCEWLHQSVFFMGEEDVEPAARGQVDSHQ